MCRELSGLAVRRLHVLIVLVLAQNNVFVVLLCVFSFVGNQGTEREGFVRDLHESAAKLSMLCYDRRRVSQDRLVRSQMGSLPLI